MSEIMGFVPYPFEKAGEDLKDMAKRHAEFLASLNNDELFKFLAHKERTKSGVLAEADAEYLRRLEDFQRKNRKGGGDA